MRKQPNFQEIMTLQRKENNSIISIRWIFVNSLCQKYMKALVLYMINTANETKNQMRDSAVIDDAEPGQCDDWIHQKMKAVSIFSTCNLSLWYQQPVQTLLSNELKLIILSNYLAVLWVILSDAYCKLVSWIQDQQFNKIKCIYTTTRQ